MQNCSESLTHFLSFNPYSRETILWRRHHIGSFNVSLYSDIYRPIPFKLGTMIDTAKWFSLIPAWMHDFVLHFWSQVCEKTEHSALKSYKLLTDLDDILYANITYSSV